MSHIHELFKTYGGHSQLINVLSNYGQLTEEENLVLIRNFNECTAPKRKILIDGNSFCDKIFFVKRGILRSYYYAPNGKEITRIFAGNNQFITNLISFRKVKENSEIIECMQASEFLFVLRSDFEKILSFSDNLKKIYTDILEDCHNQSLKRLKNTNSLDIAHKIQYLKNEFPYVVNNVSDASIASFLGISREYYVKNKHLL